MTTTVIHARIKPELKDAAQEIFNELGITMTDAITMFFTAVRRTRSLPLDVKIPNAETRRAMRDAELGRGLKSYSSAAELLADLNK